MTPTRGERNNNPCLVDYQETNDWAGQLGIEKGVGKPRFARFKTPQDGIRAAAIILEKHYRTGARTIASLVSGWAPPSENDTNAYITAVAEDMHIARDQRIDALTLPWLYLIINALIHHENGRNIYPPAVVSAGIVSAVTRVA